MTALRTLLQTSLICTSVLGGASIASAQYAPLPSAPGRWLEAVPEAGAVASGLNEGRLDADGCQLHAGVLTCTCLTADERAYQTWSDHEIGGLALRDGDELVTIGHALYIEGVWVLEDVWVLHADTVLHLEELQIGAQTEASSLTWWEADGGATISCETQIRHGRQIASASGATLRDAQWRLRGYRVGPWPVPLGKAADHAAPGFLPPLVRATGEGNVEAEGGATVFGPLFAFAAGGLDVPLALGLGVASARREEGRVLRAMLATDEGNVGAVVVGDVSFGGSTHVRGHIEHPMLERAWAVRRAETGGFFRDWRATHVGLAATAGAYALQLSGSVITEPGLPADEQAALLTYGTTFTSGDYAHWTVDLEHASDRTEDTRHSTTVGLGVDVPLGWAERAWLTPRFDLVANFAAVTVARGFDASTTLSALASAEAGLAFEGRFERGRHRLAPVVRVGGELTGIQQRQAREGAPPYPYQGPDRWRWATAFLEQSFRHGEFLFDLPVGVFVDSFGDEAITDGFGDPVVFGRLGASLPQAGVDVGAACLAGCDRVGTYIGAHVRPRADLRLSYSVADLDHTEVALMFADRLTDRGFTSLRLLSAPGTSTGFSHTASIGWRIGPTSLGVDGRLGVEPGARGVGAHLGYFWEALGWGLGVGGSLAVPTEEWAVSAGLRFAR